MLRSQQCRLDEDVVESLVEGSAKLEFEEKFAEFDAVGLDHALVAC